MHCRERRSNIDPVNSFRQQAMFARRVRPIIEGAGATFLDTYRATRRAVLQKTAHAIRFDHFSAFHFFDSGRYAGCRLRASSALPTPVSADVPKLASFVAFHRLTVAFHALRSSLLVPMIHSMVQVPPSAALAAHSPAPWLLRVEKSGCVDSLR